MTTNSNAMWVFFYAFLFLIGASLSYLAYSQYRQTQGLLAKGTKTMATVVGFIETQSENNTMYKPVFEFLDRSQIKHTYISSISSYPAPYKIGDRIKITYNPKNSEDVKTISFWGLYRWSVICFMIAAPFLILGGSYLLYSRG
ncbi:DUF3592 domain-containing protein [Maribacter polysiphoniae]|uniref:DUF3592 domain-containing protein n=1 Tax=Maribacter polysiphoniae TaxID=429344 RepID=UPI00235310C1|nr:DUF3592 domain-containing protein [Maribacter polysiphoniae]